MKNVRNLLAAFAFIMAIGTAFASLNVVGPAKQQVDGDQGSLIPGTCQTATLSSTCNTTSSKTCDIQESGTWYRYFVNENCTSPYKKP